MDRVSGDRLAPGREFSALRRRATALGVPLMTTWELTHRCPLECRHCYLDGSRERDELDAAEAKALLGAMAREGVLFLTFTGGEPLARDDFLEIATEARRLGFAWRLFTGGTLVDDALARALCRLSPVAVDISLHGLEETHDWMTRTPGSFRAAAAAAERLAGMGLTVNIKTSLTPRGLGDLAGLRDLAGRIGAGHKVSALLFPRHDGRAVDGDLVLADDDLKRHLVDPGGPAPSLSGRRPGPRGGDPLCAAGTCAFSVAPAGDVRACLMLREILGNVREAPLREVWRSEGMAAARRVASDVRSECLGCEDEEFCFPCPGLAEKETGDRLRAAPAACREARLRHELARASGVEEGSGAAPSREGCVES